jgi:hypothetical protein
VVDFAKVSGPGGAAAERLDVTDFATPVLTVNTVQQGAEYAHDHHSAWPVGTQCVSE